MTTRVRVTPASGLLVRDPSDPKRRIDQAGEIMLDSLALRRLEAAGDVTISPEGKASAAPTKSSAAKGA